MTISLHTKKNRKGEKMNIKNDSNESEKKVSTFAETQQDELIIFENDQNEQEFYKFELANSQCQSNIESIVKSFQPGVDYDVVASGKKPTLLIPGADKFTYRFNLMAKFRRDADVIDMVGRKGLIALICELIDRKTGEVIGEGRGASEVGDGQNCKTVNGAIKMAEIRAKRDAVLNLFPIRDRFTQDMEDVAKEESKAVIIDSGNGSVQIL